MNRSYTIRQLRLSRSASALSLAAALAFSTSAFAQTADAAADEENEDIVVTGYAAALDNAVEVKRDADQIVESVSAENIGRLPDASIGEAIARLPGIASQRNNGRASGIAVRGFGPDFSQTLLNGREQTTTSDNRSVEFDQYPSDVVSRVDVFKSPTAALVGQGLFATINIRTVRPLDVNERILAVGGRVSYADLGALNAGSEDIGYRGNMTYVDKFADDTLGIALSASYVNEPYQNQEFNAWGYNRVSGAVSNGTATDAGLVGGSKSFVTSTGLERLAFNGTVQWEPAPEVRVTFDGFYSNFRDEQFKRGIELPLGFFAFGTTGVPADFSVTGNHITSGTFRNVRGVIRNDIFEREADLYSFGFNAAYEGDSGWNATFDVGYSRTDRNELSLESYSGTGFNGDDTGNGAAATIRFTSGANGGTFTPSIDYSNAAAIFLTDPLGWGGGTVPQAGYSNNRIIDDELWQFRTEVEREFEGSFLRSVQFGLNYTTREKSLTPDEAFVRLPGAALQSALPSQYRLNPTNLAYLGLGPVQSYDPRALIRDGVLVLEPRNATGPNAAFDVLGKGYTVEEDLMTAYLQFNIEQEIGFGTLTGNFGVQAINTEQESSGFIRAPNGPELRTFGDNFWDVLPSLNLSLRLESNTVIRFAAAREIQRPRLDQMRLSIEYGVNNNFSENPNGVAAPFISGSGGNPFLRPYRANSFNFNVEQYFGRGGLISAQLFYKDIKSFIANGRFIFDYSGFTLPTGQSVPSPIGRIDAPINTGGGPVYGAELAVTLPLNNLTSALEGFGVTGGVGWTKTKVENAAGAREAIPGYSRWVANATAYFERWGFNARASARYRSTFIGDFTGFGGSPTRRQALPETIIDAQIGYDFQEGSALDGLSLYLQGQNLTDERFASVSSNARPQEVLDYQIYGRRFLAGFSFKF
ncbi:MAG: TonB-dependent receptor [Sphingopyxis sp.]